MIFLKDDEFDKLEKELIIKLDTNLLVERYKFYHDCYSKKVKLNNVYNIIHDECNLTENEIKKIVSFIRPQRIKYMKINFIQKSGF